MLGSCGILVVSYWEEVLVFLHILQVGSNRTRTYTSEFFAGREVWGRWDYEILHGLCNLFGLCPCLSTYDLRENDHDFLLGYSPVSTVFINSEITFTVGQSTNDFRIELAEYQLMDVQCRIVHVYPFYLNVRTCEHLSV
jgi:hypothetical protein